jgi:hypothetical protein
VDGRQDLVVRALLAPIDVLALLAAVLDGDSLAVLLHHRLALLHGVVTAHLYTNKQTGFSLAKTWRNK